MPTLGKSEAHPFPIQQKTQQEAGRWQRFPLPKSGMKILTAKTLAFKINAKVLQTFSMILGQSDAQH